MATLGHRICLGAATEEVPAAREMARREPARKAVAVADSIVLLGDRKGRTMEGQLARGLVGTVYNLCVIGMMKE